MVQNELELAIKLVKNQPLQAAPGIRNVIGKDELNLNATGIVVSNFNN
jgi:hypothetical protein